MSNLITLRNVYKIKTVHFKPGRQLNGDRFEFVKPVRYDAEGNMEMILSEAERNDPNREYFIPEDYDIVVTEGTTFDLDNPLQRNLWECIKDSDQIVPMRGAKNAKGELIIDGDKRRYGLAELYVDKPGEESHEVVTRKKRIITAQTYIINDSEDGKLTKCKLLGHSMRNAPSSDVTAYLLERAEKEPGLIIELYTDSDTSIRLLIIDAREKQIVRKVDGLNWYGEVLLGSTDESMIKFLKTPQNAKILQNIRNEVYPDMVHAIGNIQLKEIEEAGDKTMEEMIESVPVSKSKTSTKTTN